MIETRTDGRRNYYGNRAMHWLSCIALKTEKKETKSV